MSEKFSPRIHSKNIENIKTARIEKPKIQSKPELASDLNIVLSKDQINSILQDLAKVGHDIPGGEVSFWGGSCCVDASVGSSVAGPFSSVGSSVSTSAMNTAEIKERLSAEKVKVNVSLPRNLKIR